MDEYIVVMLETIETRQSDDVVKTDLEVVCTRCDAHLCDVQHGDTLGTLAGLAYDHAVNCPETGEDDR